MVLCGACPVHYLYIYAWISKQFCTVVVLKEEKCYLKYFFRYVEGQGHSGQIKVKLALY